MFEKGIRDLEFDFRGTCMPIPKFSKHLVRVANRPLNGKTLFGNREYDES